MPDDRPVQTVPAASLARAIAHVLEQEAPTVMPHCSPGFHHAIGRVRAIADCLEGDSRE